MDIIALAAVQRARAKKGEDVTTLDAAEVANIDNHTFPNGCHMAEVEIDPETGVVKVLRYSVTDDVGKAVNPLIVRGQVHGGVAQGYGQAVLEHTAFDPESGQLLSGSLMDYALPRADDLPNIEVDLIEVPCRLQSARRQGRGRGRRGRQPARRDQRHHRRAERRRCHPHRHGRRRRGEGVAVADHRKGSLSRRAGNVAGAVAQRLAPATRLSHLVGGTIVPGPPYEPCHAGRSHHQGRSQMAATDAKPDPAGHDALQQIRELREQVETLLRDRVSPMLSDAADRAQHAARHVNEVATAEAEALADRVRRKPLTALLVAAGVLDFLLGRLAR